MVENIAVSFRNFIRALSIDNHVIIELRYGEITRALNSRFRSTDSRTENSLQVGSYGRWTAIKGISDLDMLYIMPRNLWNTYSDRGQDRLLRDAKSGILARYPTTNVRVDRLVVQVIYQGFTVEVQPVFEQDDGSFLYPDTYRGGTWKVTKPRDEMIEMSRANLEKNKNLRHLCKMVRAWKNKHGIAMGGLLIDTLSHKFLMSTNFFDDKSHLYFDYMSRDFFKFISELPRQEYFSALGSRQRVRVKKTFQMKAKRAYELCLTAIEAEGQNSQNEQWRKIFGRGFPLDDARSERADIIREGIPANNTEQFIEDRFQIDIQYDIVIDCDVTQRGFRPFSLSHMLGARLPLYSKRSLRFFVSEITVPEPYQLYWKVLNRGNEAVKRNAIRGEITLDGGHRERKESSLFRGDHIVECYAVKNNIVVAKSRISVPIRERVES